MVRIGGNEQSVLRQREQLVLQEATTHASWPDPLVITG
jgi:hypothetical protein